MAKATRRTAKRGAAARGSADTSPRDRIIDALMALLAEKRLGEIGLADVAEAADVSLATLRENFDGKLGILAAFSRRIDLVVLAGGAPDASAGARDRLFEAEMRRFDALRPYKEALRGLAHSARRDLELARGLHRAGGRSAEMDAGRRRHSSRRPDGTRRASRAPSSPMPRPCAPGSTTTTRIRRAPWRPSTAASAAASGRCESSMSCAPSVPRFVDRGRRMRDDGRAARGARRGA